MNRTRSVWIGLGIAASCAPVAVACDVKHHVLAFNGKAHQQIAFSYEACPDGATVFGFDADNLLTATRANSPESVPATVRFFALGGLAPEQRILAIAAPRIASQDQGRCAVRAGPAAGTWLYTPVPAYAEELEANGLWGACGPYGDASETTQYWIAVGGVLIAYVALGLEPPPFDPASLAYRNTQTPGRAE